MLQLYDLAGIYFRAFYAVPTSMASPDGRPVNAIRGSLDILARVISDARPSRGIACLDVDWRPAWRVELLPSYKAHRVAVTEPSPPILANVTGAALGAAVGAQPGAVAESEPDELSPQVPVLLDVLRATGIALAGADGCEADDVIGTLAAREAADPVEVVSGDRDLFQLVRTGPPPVTVRYIGAGMSKVAMLDVESLRDRYGVDGPGYAAMATLRGDPSDGLPGVPGIGEKTAADLIGRFGSIEALLDAAADPASALTPAVRKRLLAAAEYLPAAVRVVAVRTDADLAHEPATGTGELPREPVEPDVLADLVAAHGIGGSVQRLLAALADR
jgi:5'-3' exonuclease